MSRPEAVAPPNSLDAGAVQTAQLLSQFAKLLNGPGPDSPEADAFLERYRENTEFVELARLSATLKRALSTGRRTSTPVSDATSPDALTEKASK